MWRWPTCPKNWASWRAVWRRQKQEWTVRRTCACQTLHRPTPRRRSSHWSKLWEAETSALPSLRSRCSGNSCPIPLNLPTFDLPGVGSVLELMPTSWPLWVFKRLFRWQTPPLLSSSDPCGQMTSLAARKTTQSRPFCTSTSATRPWVRRAAWPWWAPVGICLRLAPASWSSTCRSVRL